jgi:hypothetical protein
MTHHLREEWQDPSLPITGPKPKATRTVGVIHYSGSNNIPADKPAWLRSMQADYVNNRGYSLGYGHLVTYDGDSYEIRGDDFNMASNNGDKVDGNANDWTLSILLDVTTTAGATLAAIDTCKDLFANAGITGRPVPHSFYDYTSCCGDAVRAQIDQGLFDPAPYHPPTPTPTGVIDMYVIAVSRDGWPGPVDLVVSDEGTRWNANGNTSALDKLAGVPRLEVDKDQTLGLLIDRPGIGNCPFEILPDYFDAELAAAW